MGHRAYGPWRWQYRRGCHRKFSKYSPGSATFFEFDVVYSGMQQLRTGGAVSSASEVTTIWRYTNVYIIIIIIYDCIVHHWNII